MSLLCSGLIDEGESAEVAALRELKEETGYKGEVVGITPGTSTQRQHCTLDCFSRLSLPCIISCVCWRGLRFSKVKRSSILHIFGMYNSSTDVIVWIAVTCLDPGLSNCTTQIVMVNINGDEMENINPTQQLGENTLFHTCSNSFILSLIQLL